MRPTRPTPFLASIVESSEDAIMSSTTDGIILSWNHGAERLYGYSAEEVVGKPVSILAPTDQRSSLKWIADQLQQRRARGPIRSVGAHQGRQARQYFCFRLPGARRGRADYGARGHHARHYRAGCRRRRPVLCSPPSWIPPTTPSLAPPRMARFSVGIRAPKRCMATAPEQMLGKPISMLVPASGIGEISRLLEEVCRGETVSQLETVTVNRDGGPDRSVPHHVSGAESAPARWSGSSAIARDITPPPPRPEALQHSEEKYRRLVANLPDVVWVADETGQPVFVSSNCEQLSGFTHEEVCQPGFWMNRIHPEDQPHVADAYRALFEKAGPSMSSTGFCARMDTGPGSTAAPCNVYERNGTRYRDGLISDITERKRMEQKLAHQATHDLLTGLPNRAVFEDRFHQVLARARRQNGMAALSIWTWTASNALTTRWGIWRATR